MVDLFDIPLFSQLLVAFLSFYFFLKKKTKFLKGIALLMLMNFLVDFAGGYLSELGVRNFLVYQYSTLLEYFLILYIYKQLIKDKRYLNISYLLLIVFLILWIMVFYDRTYFYKAVIVSFLNVGVLIFLFLRELLLSDEIINYKKLLPFWVSVGFMVYYLPSIPFFSIWIYMKNKDLYPILESLIVTMNLIISFGLIWSSKRE
ncbi:hypothetical protein [uncultured Tenacibaculum sp.]|uniref:hypothetical protein n=1 Tax=uncultured Tenacibaculum sp. TaxID=174713 RepID=UPI0026366756|nr:hypothetical protein [uncultured Tenacibaculum sp.]